MLDRMNLLANAVMTLSAAAFYVMIFTKAAPGFDATQHLRPRSYWTVRVGLSFFVAGSLLATLTMPEVSVSQFTRNVGTAILFGWAAAYHAKKWGVIAAPRRKTGSIPIVK
jgi:hypothetical protein